MIGPQHSDVGIDRPQPDVEAALARLQAWLETLRGRGGYGGPVAHWWRQSLLYTGRGLDWRYEGIVDGYLTLWERTGDLRWLAKARRAGDDLLAGQMQNGHFAASGFENNPSSAGTPHEAACDVALLRLALVLRDDAKAGWQPYAEAAECNIHAFILGKLWDAGMGAVRDEPVGATFVPNKACTAAEAIFLLGELRADAEYIERYALPTLRRVLSYQIRGGIFDGAIAQNGFGARRVEKYLPIYIARCVPALLRANTYTGEAHWADAALRALGFIARQMCPQGRLPTVVYPDGSSNLWPAWVAPLGDVLRAADLLRPYGFATDMSAAMARLLAGQRPSGAICTAEGFAAQPGGRPGQLPDLRDLLGVAGWCDKAFRYLAGRCTSPLPAAMCAADDAACIFRGRGYTLSETSERLELSRGGRARYRWVKGQPWAAAAPEFWAGG